MNYAIACRRLQFRSGPESQVFYCCLEHRPRLEDGSAGNGCFFASPKDPIQLVELTDEIECDECREGGYEDWEPPVRRKLTRQEQLEGLADRGIDTWEEYRGER